MTQAGLVLGTGPYLAPEVSLGDKYDGRADQYALAATVYEVLGGRVPFGGTSLQAILFQQTTGKLTPLCQIVPAVPLPLSQAIQKALDPDPRKRYPDCATFARAVLSAATGEVITAFKAGAAPMASTITCQFCKKSFRLPPNADGRNLVCPSCGARHAVAKRAPVATAAETSRAVGPQAPTQATRLEAVPRKSNTMTWLVLGGIGAGVFAVSCVGLLFVFLGASLFGIASRHRDPALEPEPVPVVQVNPQPKPDPPANPPPVDPPAPPPVQPPVPPPNNPLPPVQPAGQDLGSGIFLVQSMTRVTDIAGNAKKLQGYGYNDGISLLSAWVDKGKSVSFNTPLIANTDYMFLAAGDKDAQVIDLEVFDLVTNQRVANDQTNHPEAIVAYRPKFSGKYSLKITLFQSNKGFPCMCSLVMLKRPGWSIAFKNLDDVTYALAKTMSDLNKSQAGNRKYEFRTGPNQWAVYGGALKPGQELSVTNINLGFGDCVVIGGCDKCSNRLDLYLSRNKNPVSSYTGPASIEPFIIQRSCLGRGYGLRLRNSSTVPGASLVMMAAIDMK